MMSCIQVAGSFLSLGRDMNRKHQKTLDEIFANPVSGSIKWRDIEAMLLALGAEVAEGRGSRIRVFIGRNHAVFHRPHPSPDTDKGAVKAVRRFLTQSGIEP
jgi:uracil DNA glycosylase